MALTSIVTYPVCELRRLPGYPHPTGWTPPGVGFGSLLIARVRDCAIQPPGQFASITPEDIERSPIFVGEESEVASNPQRLLKPRTIRGFIHVRLPDRAISPVSWLIAVGLATPHAGQYTAASGRGVS